MSLRRIAVRSSSDSRPQARPPRMTSPASGRSSSPAVCSSVDLPAPDGATSATDLARPQREVGAVRMVSFAAPWTIVPLDAQFDRSSLIGAASASLVPQRFDRIEPRGAPRRKQRGERTTAPSAISTTEIVSPTSILAGSCDRK